MNDGLTCDFSELKRQAKELLDAAPGLNEEELENGLKMFKISYLSMKGSQNECHQAAILFTLVLRQTGQLTFA